MAVGIDTIKVDRVKKVKVGVINLLDIYGGLIRWSRLKR
jgi:hypothetical protein